MVTGNRRLLSCIRYGKSSISVFEAIARGCQFAFEFFIEGMLTCGQLQRRAILCLASCRGVSGGIPPTGSALAWTPSRNPWRMGRDRSSGCLGRVSTGREKLSPGPPEPAFGGGPPLPERTRHHVGGPWRIVRNRDFSRRHAWHCRSRTLHSIY